MKQNRAIFSGPQELPISNNEGVKGIFDIASYFHPEYTATIHGRKVVSPSILELLKQGASPEVNFKALNVFLRSGFYIGTETLFSAIQTREVPYPASFSLKPTSGNRNAIIDEYIELFRQAMQRQIRTFGSNGICMGLSGGRDSRHILLELCRVGVKPHVCWTIDVPNSPSEVTIARQLTDRAGVPHVSLPGASGVESERYKNHATSFESTEHCWSVAAIPIIQRHLVNYDGMAGMYFQQVIFSPRKAYNWCTSDALMNSSRKSLSRWPRAPGSRSKLFSRQTALEEVSAEVQRHLAMPNPIGSFYLWNRTRRTIGSSAFGLLCPSGQQTCISSS